VQVVRLLAVAKAAKHSVEDCTTICKEVPSTKQSKLNATTEHAKAVQAK